MQKEPLIGDRVFLVHGLLSPQECADHVALSEAAGYEDAGLGGVADPVVFKQLRDNARVLRDDAALSTSLFERVEPFLPDWEGWRPVGLSSYWRYYRYDPGQRFAPHMDGCHSTPEGDRSWFTLLIYLNEEFEGDGTNFYRSRHDILRVRPPKGSAVVFAHEQMHEGAEVLSGRKYALRTDVMYRPTSAESPDRRAGSANDG